jgi:predicted enzyme related to lactoylglutathione lyase
VDLFAGISVSDFQRALAWYERLMGAPPSFFPNDIEAVWEVAEHGWFYIQLRPDHAGHALHTIFVDDFDERIQAISGRGIESTELETYENGVRKAIYSDPDGNEIGIGGAPGDG